jgi:hypothetical protein
VYRQAKITLQVQNRYSHIYLASVVYQVSCYLFVLMRFHPASRLADSWLAGRLGRRPARADVRATGRAGGCADGRVGGRMGGQTDGRAGGRTGEGSSFTFRRFGRFTVKTGRVYIYIYLCICGRFHFSFLSKSVHGTHHGNFSTT